MDPVIVWCFLCGVCNIGSHLSDISDELRKLRRLQERPAATEMRSEALAEVVVAKDSHQA